MDIQRIIEAALFAAGTPLTIHQLQDIFPELERPERSEVTSALDAIADEYRRRPIELREVASGFRFQVRQELSPWVSRLFEERPPKYSRALLETLAIIVYKQPLTRGDIEQVRGVSVSTNIIRTLLDREWVRVVGHKEVPGRPALYATTRLFLDYFNVKSLDELPPLAAIPELAPSDVTEPARDVSEASDEDDENPT